MTDLSLYIHIPFCVKKCSYCDFVSYKVSDFENNLGIENYMAALEKEIDLNHDLLASAMIATLYIGGGTPSSIPGHHIHALINKLKSISTFSKDVEITIEVNPGTLDETKLNHYLSAGVNRISMGLQTTNDDLLKTIGRIHNTNDFISSFEAIKRAGFKNISLDLMFGLPAQTIQDINKAIELISTLKPNHVSAYSLKIEEGTPLYERYEKGGVQLPDEALEREMYHTIENKLSELGIHQYELSNFAVEGAESKHNKVYWKNQAYLGLGVSAHSKFNHVRHSNTNQINTYIEALSKGQLATDEDIYIDAKEDRFETIMLGLRLNEGISIQDIETRYVIDFNEKYGAVVKELLENGLIEVNVDNIRLTSLGRDLANQVFVRFLED